MKRLIQFTAIVLFFGGQVFSAQAGFSSIYIWGDSISTTTNNVNPLSDPQFYGQRNCNGRTWVEVLAQRQGLGANSITNPIWNYNSNNFSYFGHYSSNVVADVNGFSQPANATNCLFVLWVGNADFYGDMLSATVGDPTSSQDGGGTNLAIWTTAINQHLTNHYNIITNLYAKGCRTLVAPNVADLSTIPSFNNSGVNYPNYPAFIRQRIISFNTNYVAMLKQIAANSPGLTICVPDIFTLLNNVLTNAAAYGLTNALGPNGYSTDVIDALNPAGINGPGTNYIFWDTESNPTAKMSEVIADSVQQSLSPARFTRIAAVGASNRLDMVNMPIGLTNGFVLSATALTQKTWLTNVSFITQTATQSVFVPVAGAPQFYRLQFPWQWTWP